jgi:hypothetical protein
MTPVVVFILGTNRSGSTWLNLVLGSHSWAANVGEFYRPFLDRGHVVCRLCEANDLPTCTVLGTLDGVPEHRAYHVAAERLGSNCIIDASKRLDWCARFTGRTDLTPRLVHLVRHPAGFVASERARTPQASVDSLFEQWCLINREVEAFTEASGCPCRVVAYDDLADSPSQEFPKLCEWIGGHFEAEALEYWRVDHHGLGANGAASLYLDGRKRRHWERSEDAYYEELQRGRMGADTRWAERLDPRECDRLLAHPYVQAIRERIGSNRSWATVAEALASDRAARLT